MIRRNVHSSGRSGTAVPPDLRLFWRVDKGLCVVNYGPEKYDRAIEVIYDDDTLINHWLVAAGRAWHYVKYAPHDTTLAEAKKQSHELRTGR